MRNSRAVVRRADASIRQHCSDGTLRGNLRGRTLLKRVATSSAVAQKRPLWAPRARAARADGRPSLERSVCAPGWALGAAGCPRERSMVPNSQQTRGDLSPARFYSLRSRARFPLSSCHRAGVWLCVRAGLRCRRVDVTRLGENPPATPPLCPSQQVPPGPPDTLSTPTCTGRVQLDIELRSAGPAKLVFSQCRRKYLPARSPLS